MLSYRGKGVYRRTVTVENDSAIRLEFKGVSHTAKIYIDGQFIAEHYNAYTPFDVILPEVLAGTHELLVEVDNSFSESSTLHIPNDYYTYGENPSKRSRYQEESR